MQQNAYQSKDEYAVSTFQLAALPLQQALDEIAARGFHSVEVWAAGFHMDVRGDGDVGALRGWLQKNDQRVHSVHAPFFHRMFEPPAEEEAFRKYRVEIYRRTIEMCEAIECPILVVHLLNRDEFNYTLAQLPLVRDEFAQVIAHGKAHGVSIAVENIIGGGMPDEIVCTLQEQVRLLDGLDARYCLDIGHAPLSAVSLYDEADAAGEKLVTFHIHNNDGIADSHALPDDGVIDWPALYRYVREKGYDGQFVFEVAGGGREEGPQVALQRLDHLAGLFDT